MKHLATLILLTTLGLSSHGFAAEVTGSSSSIDVKSNHSYVTKIKIAGPNNFHMESDSLYISFSESLVDGSYTYEIFAETDKAPSPSLNNNGRGQSAVADKVLTEVVDRGAFHIRNGVVSASDIVE